ncbi:hypothetical protein Zmor_027503 [Zophobas morio]|uniref:NADH dehydrogenase [ubiquinone] 1 beta subcomplex subunit 2, mitochondrial n=1 Tax=Zophobas morio TaxID=2755281 RepID=A0AA38M2L6_9CUCU|nr:hypothetical protein Zmor_027503 [Zophobas morio]
MLLSRGLSVLRTTKLLRGAPLETVQQVRNSSHVWSYRSAGPPPTKNLLWAAEAVQGFAWWWVLWHLYTEPGHVTGEFPYPDPRQWSDEELGIPSS